MAKLFWISWYQPTEDHRPIGFPPINCVLGWWCTGRREEDGAATLVAWVRASNERMAKARVRVEWPEAKEWRFCEERERVELSSRFPLSDWMRSRMLPSDEAES